MEIIENDLNIKVIKDGQIFHYSKPSYKNYNYTNLISKLFELNVNQIIIGIKTCNIVSNNKILTKLKKFFGSTNVIFTGNYKDKTYQYNIKIMNDVECENFLKKYSK